MNWYTSGSKRLSKKRAANHSGKPSRHGVGGSQFNVEKGNSSRPTPTKFGSPVKAVVQEMQVLDVDGTVVPLNPLSFKTFSSSKRKRTKTEADSLKRSAKVPISLDVLALVSSNSSKKPKTQSTEPFTRFLDTGTAASRHFQIGQPLCNPDETLTEQEVGEGVGARTNIIENNINFINDGLEEEYNYTSSQNSLQYFCAGIEESFVPFSLPSSLLPTDEVDCEEIIVNNHEEVTQDLHDAMVVNMERDPDNTNVTFMSLVDVAISTEQTGQSSIL
jgi:hypothetical protein